MPWPRPGRGTAPASACVRSGTGHCLHTRITLLRGSVHSLTVTLSLSHSHWSPVENGRLLTVRLAGVLILNCSWLSPAPGARQPPARHPSTPPAPTPGSPSASQPRCGSRGELARERDRVMLPRCPSVGPSLRSPPCLCACASHQAPRLAPLPCKTLSKWSRIRPGCIKRSISSSSCCSSSSEIPGRANGWSR